MDQKNIYIFLEGASVSRLWALCEIFEMSAAVSDATGCANVGSTYSIMLSIMAVEDRTPNCSLC